MAEEKSLIITLKQRMKTGHGLDIDLYTKGLVGYPWATGFRSGWKDDKSHDSFTLAILSKKGFCVDTAIGGSQHKGMSLREVSTLDSLHVIITKAFLEIHADTISVAASRNSKTRRCEYAYGKVLDHLVNDLKHWPLIVPSSEKGLVIGVRF